MVIIASAEDARKNFKVLCRTAACDVIFSNSRGERNCAIAPPPCGRPWLLPLWKSGGQSGRTAAWKAMHTVLPWYRYCLKYFWLAPGRAVVWAVNGVTKTSAISQNYKLSFVLNICHSMHVAPKAWNNVRLTYYLFVHDLIQEFVCGSYEHQSDSALFTIDTIPQFQICAPESPEVSALQS